MISMLIVIGSLTLAVAFSLAWLLRSDLREQVERPKHSFQDQLRQYDRRCQKDGDKI